jgi:hypothetical protein
VLASPSPSALPALLRHPEGFSWWYVDLTTPAGDGLVLIWSLGLPFLPPPPTVTAAPRAARPALSLAVYRRGRPDLYLLQDYGEASARVSLGRDVLGSGRLGETTFDAEIADDRLELRVRLDEPVPGTERRLTGSITLSGPACAAVEDRSEAQHLWAPRVLHGVARAALRLGQERVDLEGAGYFDSNFSRVPLRSQGIARWLWGRITFPDRTLAYYRTEGDDGQSATRILSQGLADPGQSRSGVLQTGNVKRGVFGVRSPRRVGFDFDDVRVMLELGQPVDDGPFYQRFLVRGRDGRGQLGHGIAEVVVPGSLDRPWQRPFIRMRTHVVGGQNSFWLPLFSGTRQGRIRRLLRPWAP